MPFDESVVNTYKDFEPVKAFFNGEQLEIFTRALDMLAIYDDSKTYIVDSELEGVVKQMRTIVRMERPYSEIPKLPELRQRFMEAYLKVLKAEETPVLDSIAQDRARVLEVLRTKEYYDEKKDAYAKSEPLLG